MPSIVVSFEDTATKTKTCPHKTWRPTVARDICNVSGSGRYSGEKTKVGTNKRNSFWLVLIDQTEQSNSEMLNLFY